MIPVQAAYTYQAPILCNGNCEARAIAIRDQLDSGALTLAQYNAQIGNLATNPAPNIHVLGPFEFFGSVGSRNYCQNTYDSNMRIAALRKMDFVWDIFYHSNSMLMWYSDIIVPQANPFFYDHGFETPSNDVYGNYFIYHGKMADLQGEQRTGLWISTQLASYLGVGDKVNTKLQNVSIDQWDSVLDQLYQESYVAWTGSQSAKDLGIQLPSWDDFVKSPVMRIPNRHHTSDCLPKWRAVFQIFPLHRRK